MYKLREKIQRENQTHKSNIDGQHLNIKRKKNEKKKNNVYQIQQRILNSYQSEPQTLFEFLKTN